MKVIVIKGNFYYIEYFNLGKDLRLQQKTHT